MQQLEIFERELYSSAMVGRTWSYVPRIEGVMFGLAIITVGQPGKVDIPFESCCSTSFEDIKSHADDLNAVKLSVPSCPGE